MEVYVIRHTAVNVPRSLCYGHTNVPLKDTFAQEVVAVKEKLPASFDAVFASPLERCRVLAEALELGAPQWENNLKELNFGAWENTHWDDIPPEQLNPWMADFVHGKPPQGESLQQVYDRVGEFLAQLRTQDHERVLVVTHAGPIRCFWTHILGNPLNTMFRIPVEFGEVLGIHLTPDSARDSIFRKL